MKLSKIMPAGETLPGRGRGALSLAARAALTLLVMALPAIIVCALTYLAGFDPFRAVPLWLDDETHWYLQYAAMSKYGHPLGYFGYAGSHAAVGTFSSWGMYPATLTGTLARIFGWNLHAFVVYNFVYLALAALLFILLTKPSLRSMVMLALSNCMMYVAFCYCIVAMNEIARYSVAIVLAGIMYRLLAEPQVPRWRLVIRCTVVPLLLLWATCFYLLLALFIPVYIFLMLRQPVRRLPLAAGSLLRGAAAAVVTVPAVHFLRALNARTCAPYRPPVQGSAVSFALPSARAKLTMSAFDLLGNAKDLDPVTLLTNGESGAEHALMLWFCVLVFVSLGVFLWRTVRSYKRGDQTTAELNLLCAFLLAGCVGGMILEYNTTTWTFVRNCSTGVCCVMLLAALAPKGEAHGWRTMAIIGLAGVVTFLNVFTTVFATAARFPAQSIEDSWEQTRQELADVIVLDEDAQDPWSNTVVLYHADTSVYYMLPYGVGVNGYVKDAINKNARYVILGQDYEDGADREADAQTLLDGGHQVIYENDQFTVYENQARTYG